MHVYYFTSAAHAVSNIAFRRVKVSRYEQLNDPFELLAINLGNKVTRQKFKDLKAKMDKEEGLICFCPDWKNPVTWGHYADKHRGVALGFKIPDELLNEVQYQTKLGNALNDPDDFTLAQIRTLKVTKFKDWEYEHERRQFIDLSLAEKEGPNYFLPFSEKLVLREVVLGSSCDLSAANVYALLQRTSLDAIVTKARMANLTFTVRQDLTVGPTGQPVVIRRKVPVARRR